MQLVFEYEKWLEGVNARAMTDQGQTSDLVSEVRQILGRLRTKAIDIAVLSEEIRKEKRSSCLRQNRSLETRSEHSESLNSDSSIDWHAVIYGKQKRPSQRKILKRKAQFKHRTGITD